MGTVFTAAEFRERLIDIAKNYKTTYMWGRVWESGDGEYYYKQSGAVP